MELGFFVIVTAFPVLYHFHYSYRYLGDFYSTSNSCMLQSLRYSEICANTTAELHYLFKNKKMEV